MALGMFRAFTGPQTDPGLPLLLPSPQALPSLEISLHPTPTCPILYLKSTLGDSYFILPHVQNPS